MKNITATEFKKIMKEAGLPSYGYVDILNIVAGFCFENALENREAGRKSLADSWSKTGEYIFNTLDDMGFYEGVL